MTKFREKPPYKLRNIWNVRLYTGVIFGIKNHLLA
jgi:hypothetical protein